MTDKLLLTDVGGKDTQRAIDDLERHKLPSTFSYRQAYFVGAEAQLAVAKPILLAEGYTKGCEVTTKAFSDAVKQERERIRRELLPLIYNTETLELIERVLKGEK